MWFLLLGIPVGWLARKWFAESKNARPAVLGAASDDYLRGYAAGKYWTADKGSNSNIDWQQGWQAGRNDYPSPAPDPKEIY